MSGDGPRLAAEPGDFARIEDPGRSPGAWIECDYSDSATLSQWR